MDTEQHYCAIDFLKHVDDDHLLKKLALSIASDTYLPAHTVFLMGLGVFASIACRQWSVKNQQGKALPIGLYVFAEQPTGTGKSYCLNIFQQPFYVAEARVKHAAEVELSKLLSIEKKDRSDSQAAKIKKRQRIRKTTIFITSFTIEGLKQTFIDTGGYFSE
jgi:hypothetical protein